MNRPTDDNDNRIRSVVDSVIGTEDPDDLMVDLMGALTEGSKVPEVGGYYTFVYTPKTPNISYDSNPLVAVTDVFEWGFRGINFHHQEYRQYTWEELGTQVYIVQQDELDDLLSLSYGKLVLNK